LTARHWAVLVPPEQYAGERQASGDRLPAGLGVPEQAVPSGSAGPRPGDRVVLIADQRPPVIFALGQVDRAGALAYTRRLFDAPLPADDLRAGVLDPAGFAAIEAAAGPPPPARRWLVSVDLPIEAESPAAAVRQFWGYLRQLGPSELPAFVSPDGDELAMQAFLLGEQTNLDPEDDE
jgi:hypothetical protein